MSTSEFKNVKDIEFFFNENKVFDFLEVDKIGIFGSFARGEKANDIDILLEGVRNKQKAMSLKEDLEVKSKKKLDFVFEEYANPIILHRAKKDLIYVKKHQK